MRKILVLVLWLSAVEAAAFCGFFVAGADTSIFNEASQVILVRDGRRTTINMLNDFKGEPDEFALVVPVPVVLQKEQVKTIDAKLFAHVDQLSAPRLVEYWEQDPCAPHVVYEVMMGRGAPTAALRSKSVADADYGVEVKARFAVGEYQIVILGAKESTGLERWLHDHKYQIPKGAAEVLAPYIQQKMNFFVAKVDVTKVKRDEAGFTYLSPLQFTFEHDAFELPIRIGMLNANGPQDLITFVIAQQRYEVSSYPTVSIPTNLEVPEETAQDFASFYLDLFDRTVSRDGPVVVTEYAWDTSSCDPCPGPVLTPDELHKLGAPEAWSTATLTRLHARYTKKTFPRDLTFAAAAPLQGGRGFDNVFKWEPDVRMPVIVPGPQGVNNFQGRYIIYHRWTGPISCAQPVRGNWGGPPQGRPSRPIAATDLGAAMRTRKPFRPAGMSAKPISKEAPATPKSGSGQGCAASPGARP